MAFGRQAVLVGGLGLALAAAMTVAACAQVQVPNAPRPQQSVPDAPKPQTLPQVNILTPTGPVLPPAPTPSDSASTDNNGAVPSSLPGSPQATDQHNDDSAPPVIPAAGQALQTENKVASEAEAENDLPASTTGTIRVHVQFVEVPFIVKDAKGRLVPSLTWRDVRINENGLRQSPKFFTVDPFPLSVALVIDQSVTNDTMEKINDSLSALQGAFTPYDEVAVFTYNNGVTKQTDFTAAQSARLGVILDRSKGTGRDPVMGLTGPLTQTTNINNLQVDPNTTAQRGQQGITLNAPREFHTLNDAILAAAQQTATAGRGRRRIVYVISDGKEYGSKISQKQVIKYLETNNVAVYATLVGDSAVPGMGFLDRIHLPLTLREDVLPKYAAATGGQVDPEFRPKGIEASFARITEEVRAQYTIGYYTHASPFDERFRKIEVLVLRPGLTVIAKDGYYPSASDNRPQPTVVRTAAPAASSSSTPQ